MSDDRTTWISKRAYDLWEAAGRPGNRDQEYWFQAVEEQKSNELARAMQIAAAAHEGQSDKAGAPYFSHCKRVADNVESHDEKIVAYLHDIVEKGQDWTLDRIRAEGFASEIIDAVNALTRRPGETDEELVTRAAGNALARPVKLADLTDNLAQAKETGADTAKYVAGLQTLEILRAHPNVDEI